MASKRRKRCTGLSVTTGKRCRSSPLKGTDRCAAHPQDPEAAGSTRFGSPEQAKAAGALGGRPKMPNIPEAARKLLDDHAEVFLRPYFRTLGYDVLVSEGEFVLVELPKGGAKLYGTSQKTGGIRVSKHDDLGAMTQVAERLIDRVYGKATAKTEVSGAGGGPVQVATHGVDLRNLSDDDLQLLEEIQARAAAASTDAP